LLLQPAFAFVQESFDLGPPRHPAPAAEAGAFDRRGAEAKRTAARSPMPSAKASAKAPCQVSPAPSVSDGLDAERRLVRDGAVLYEVAAALAHRDREPGVGAARNGAQGLRGVVLPRDFREPLFAERHMRRERECLRQSGLAVRIEHRRNAGFAGEAEEMHRPFRPARIAENGADARGQRGGKPGGIGRDIGVGIGDDQPLAPRIDEDRRGRGALARKAPGGRAIDALAFEFHDDGIARHVVAEARREPHRAAEPRDRDRGIGRDAAAHHWRGRGRGTFPRASAWSRPHRRNRG
jgi:hypothetical protein